MTDHDNDGAGRAADHAGEDATLEPLTLAQRVEQLESLLRTVAWGVTSETDELKAALSDLEDRVDQLRPAAAAAGDVGAAGESPRAWVDQATTEQWAQLVDWVDWLTATYDVAPSRAVPPCWPAHRGVSEELAGLWLAWRAAVATLVGDEQDDDPDDEPDEVEPDGERDDVAGVADPTDALIAWHDRWLHPCLARLHSEYQVRECIDGHKAPRPGRRTDRALLPAAKDRTSPAGTTVTP